MNKICFSCGLERPLYEFGDKQEFKDGKNDICKVCKHPKWSLYYDPYARQCSKCKKIIGVDEFGEHSWVCRCCHIKSGRSKYIILLRNVYKVCKVCNNNLQLSHYYVNKDNEDYREDICKECFYSAPIEKRCSKCKIIKNLGDFNKIRGQKYGVSPQCIKCEKENSSCSSGVFNQCGWYHI